MLQSTLTAVRRRSRPLLRSAFSLLPQETRHGVYRSLASFDNAPDPRLQLRIADTREDLEACFRLLHDAYVGSGFMQPHPSGMRVTPYHALPTTTTLAALWEGRVVGTLSLVREGVFGFPMQSAFDLSGVRMQGGGVAEASALAVHPKFRRAGGMILFPLMKFLYEYCTTYFDTRHLLIAVNPDHIDMYQSLLLFKRLQDSTVSRYDFANGAPAVGATLDLVEAPEHYRAIYGKRPANKNLHQYFCELQMPNIQRPVRPYYTTNDPVMTPALLDYFFNEKTDVFARMDVRQRVLLHSIYGDTAHAAVLPPLPGAAQEAQPIRRHPRYSIKLPASLLVDGCEHPLSIFEISSNGFQAAAMQALPDRLQGRLRVRLGEGLESRIEAVMVRSAGGNGMCQGFFVHSPDKAWLDCVQALEQSQTHMDLGRRVAA